MKTSEFYAEMLLYKWEKGEEITEIEKECLERLIKKDEEE